MDNYKVVKYTPSFYNEWNDFIKNSKNGTFLFHRDFMDYHNDRFEDYSLLVFKKTKLIAILPANKVDREIYSHQGLSYGGVILHKDIKLKKVVEVFESLLKHLKASGFENLIIKQIPSIYKHLFAEEVLYLMFVLKANLIRRDVLSVVDLRNKLKISKNREEGYKRALKYHLVIKEEDDFELFWNHILIKNLKSKHNVEPVHTVEEITKLKQLFPNNIRQFNVYDNDKIVAGATIFESHNVAHTQYISGDENKNILGSLDFLHIYLIDVIFKNKKFFDFGTSNEKNGLKINKGLQFWKEGFGARTDIQDVYKVDVNNYLLLKDVFV